MVRGYSQHTVINRLQAEGGPSFKRGMTVLWISIKDGMPSYKRGFGDPKGDYWLGLDNIHRLTKDDDKKIRVDLALHNETAFAEYSLFAVSNETEQYKLILGGYSGTFYTS